MPYGLSLRVDPVRVLGLASSALFFRLQNQRLGIDHEKHASFHYEYDVGNPEIHLLSCVQLDGWREVTTVLLV